MESSTLHLDLNCKKICVVAPMSSSTFIYNFFSTVLLAISDAKYNTVHVKIGEYESNNNSGVFDMFENHIPEPEALSSGKWTNLGHSHNTWKKLLNVYETEPGSNIRLVKSLIFCAIYCENVSGCARCTALSSTNKTS